MQKSPNDPKRRISGVVWRCFFFPSFFFFTDTNQYFFLCTAFGPQNTRIESEMEGSDDGKGPQVSFAFFILRILNTNHCFILYTACTLQNTRTEIEMEGSDDEKGLKRRQTRRLAPFELFFFQYGMESRMEAVNGTRTTIRGRGT